MFSNLHYVYAVMLEISSNRVFGRIHLICKPNTRVTNCSDRPALIIIVVVSSSSSSVAWYNPSFKVLRFTQPAKWRALMPVGLLFTTAAFADTFPAHMSSYDELLLDVSFTAVFGSVYKCFCGILMHALRFAPILFDFFNSRYKLTLNGRETV